MDLKDMILVMENYKGTERNMLMTLEDYKKFVAIDDMSELADQMLLLGRTLAEGFTEYYRAANVTVFAKFCRDDVELGRFLQGYYNDSKKFYFDKATSSPECITKMDEIGMTDRGWIDDFILHYEKCDRTFERGQTFHNFNDHDYMVLEALSPRNLVVMDMKSGSLTIALGATEYKRYPKDEEPTKDNTTIGVSWEHGIYLGSTLSQTNFKAYKREYGTPEKIKDVYDYRAKLKQKFYFYQDLSKDDDIPKNMQNDFLHQMYKEFGTIEEEYFYDRLEDGKYDEGFKERPKQMQLDHGDIGVLYGNLVDNAVEACSKVPEGQRFVKIENKYQSGILLLVITNSKTGKKNKSLKTTKKDNIRHGHGVQSVRKVIEKYNGTVSFTDKGDIFEVSAMLYGIEVRE